VTTNELLPCPCCGSTVEYTSTPEEERVACMCGITMTAITWPVLLVKWNMRLRPNETEQEQADRLHLVGILDRMLAANAGSIIMRPTTAAAIRKHLSRP